MIEMDNVYDRVAREARAEAWAEAREHPDLWEMHYDIAREEAPAPIMDDDDDDDTDYWAVVEHHHTDQPIPNDEDNNDTGDDNATYAPYAGVQADDEPEWGR